MGKITTLAVPGALAHRLLYPKWPTGSGNMSNPRLLDPPINFYKISLLILWEPQKSKMAARRPKNGLQGLERRLTLGFWALPSTFTTCFLIQALLLWEKVMTEKKRVKKLKRMSFIVATNVVASRPPECQPTWMLTTRAKKSSICHETNSVWYGSSNSFKMAPPESVELQYFHLTNIIVEKDKFVSKLFLSTFKCFKLIFFSKKRRKINGKSVYCWPHPPTLMELSFFFDGFT